MTNAETKALIQAWLDATPARTKCVKLLRPLAILMANILVRLNADVDEAVAALGKDLRYHMHHQQREDAKPWTGEVGEA